MGKCVLVLGGVRSGKSRFAEALTTQLASIRGCRDVLYVATAEARDEEMARRIRHHRAARPASWQTWEQPLGVGRRLMDHESSPRIAMVDCLTLLVSNVMLQSHDDFTRPEHFVDAEARVRGEIDELIVAAKDRERMLVIVSGEVGMGVVPESTLGRLFRDLLGWANQQLAHHANVTYLMVAGRAINVTRMSTNVEDAARELST